MSALAAPQSPWGSISGRVVYEGTGVPVAGARVFIPSSTWECTSFSTGSYILGHLPPGAYALHVDAPSLPLQIVSGIQVDAGRNVVLDLSVVSTESGILQGYVTLSDTGRPIPDVQVTLLSHGITTLTDSKGFYSFPAAPGGPTLVEAAKTGYHPFQDGPVTIVPGAGTALDFRLGENALEGVAFVTRNPGIELGGNPYREDAPGGWNIYLGGRVNSSTEHVHTGRHAIRIDLESGREFALEQYAWFISTDAGQTFHAGGEYRGGVWVKTQGLVGDAAAHFDVGVWGWGDSSYLRQETLFSGDGWQFLEIGPYISELKKPAGASFSVRFTGTAGTLWVDDAYMGYSLSDTDGDGLLDSSERRVPGDNETNRYLADSDGDGLPDGVEHFGSRMKITQQPFEIRNSEFPILSTHPRMRDTDGDHFLDGLEVMAEVGTDPTVPDSGFVDMDGDELPASLDVDDNAPDQDGDRFADGYEAVMLGIAGVSDSESLPALGDVTVDGQLDNADAQAILSHFAYQGIPGTQPSHADLDRNGIIDNADAQRSLGFFGHIVEVLPAE